MTSQGQTLFTHLGVAVAIVLLPFASVAHPTVQDVCVMEGGPTTSMLDPRICHVDRPAVAAVCKEEDWRNPFIGVAKEGIWWRSLSSPRPTLVAAEDLATTLAALPLSDWPYGNIIAHTANWTSGNAAFADTARAALRAIAPFRSDTRGLPVPETPCRMGYRGSPPPR